jgi:hypothetical protein
MALPVLLLHLPALPCSMCLFLQTQNFQEWTTALVQDMHSQTAAANASLSAIKGQLHSQQQVLQQSLQSLVDLQTVQLQVAHAAQAGLAEVKAVGTLSVGIQQAVNESLTMTVRMQCWEACVKRFLNCVAAYVGACSAACCAGNGNNHGLQAPRAF